MLTAPYMVRQSVFQSDLGCDIGEELECLNGCIDAPSTIPAGSVRYVKFITIEGGYIHQSNYTR